MIAIVCGGRDYPPFCEAERDFLQQFGHTEVITGGAQGADTWAHYWARSARIDTLVFHANWGKYGKSAGSLRNRCMLDYLLWVEASGQEVSVIAFPGWRGTADMCEVASSMQVPVFHYEKE